jgi:hypothetical protein
MTIPLDARKLISQAGGYEPQHQDNWVIEIAGLGGNSRELISLSVQSSALPTESNDEIEVSHGNERRYYAGKAMFETIPLVVKDWVDRGVRQVLLDWRRQVYDPAIGKIGLASEYKKTGDLIISAANGEYMRRVRLFGLWPQSMEGGDLDMTGSDQVLISLTLRYDTLDWILS